MKTLPANLILEKNRLASPNAWLVTLDITLTDTPPTKFYLVNNTEDITFNGQLYTAINFEIDPAKSYGSGQIPVHTLRVSNVTRILQAYLEATNGGVDSEVTVRVVNTAYLNENYAELEMNYSVLFVKSNALWVAFTLGAPNPLRKRCPLNRYIAEYCNWQFGLQIATARECNYQGWQSAHAYALNDMLIETATDTTIHRYKCTTAGVSGVGKPAFPASGTVNDGTAVWTESGIDLCKRTLDDCRALQNTERFGGYAGLGGGNVRFA